MKKSVVAIFLLTLSICSVQADADADAAADEVKKAQYDAVFNYSSDETFRFPDFDLKYVGAKPGPFYPNSSLRMADILEFKITSRPADTEAGNGDAAVVNNLLVTWSAGTGDIGPSFFKTAGKCWRLEISFSDKHHKLAPGDGVVALERNDYCR